MLFPTESKADASAIISQIEPIATASSWYLRTVASVGNTLDIACSILAGLTRCKLDGNASNDDWAFATSNRLVSCNDAHRACVCKGSAAMDVCNEAGKFDVLLLCFVNVLEFSISIFNFRGKDPSVKITD